MRKSYRLPPQGLRPLCLKTIFWKKGRKEDTAFCFMGQSSLAALGMRISGGLIASYNHTLSVDWSMTATLKTRLGFVALRQIPASRLLRNRSLDQGRQDIGIPNDHHKTLQSTQRLIVNVHVHIVSLSGYLPSTICLITSEESTVSPSARNDCNRASEIVQRQMIV